MARGTVAILSTENLLHNYKTVQQASPKSLIMPMVKANAYGHGIRSVAKRLSNQNNLFSFGVASIEEALALRDAGVANSITLMEGVFAAYELEVAAKNNFNLVVHNELQLKWLKEYSNKDNKLNVWLKVDTGMGRLGVNFINAESIYNELSSISCINKVIGIMSHLSCADNINASNNELQLSIFNKYLKHLPGLKSICNSASIFNFPNYHYDVVRPGIVLYGISPILNTPALHLNLKPVMSLWSQIIAIKTIPKDSAIGYKSEYICDQDTKIGIIAIGYGDGYLRSSRNFIPVVVNGIRCPIVGRISMDMISIDLSNCPNAAIGDKVELWGKTLPVEELAIHTGNSEYDMITNIQYRVKFEWQD